MLAQLYSPKMILLYAFIASAMFVHFRGRERLRFARQLTDHSTFTAPYNVLMYLFSSVPTTPRIDPGVFPELQTLRDNWETIRDEAMDLYEAGHTKGSEKFDDVAFNSFFRKGWTRFYLKWYDDYLPSARALCPQTCALVESLPTINAALFAVLAPHSRLGRHRDPFAGSLRYHLGLVTPNSDECFILVDGQPYSWRDGEDLVFDETFVHEAHNDTETTRIILFCDVHRPLRFAPVDALNRFFVKHIAKISSSRNEEGEKVGVLNRIFRYVYKVRLLGKRLKERSTVVYYSVKYVLFGGILYLIFLS